MQAFNNDPQLKDELLTHIKWHQDQDRIAHGHYGHMYGIDDQSFRACAVGCSIRSLYLANGFGVVTKAHDDFVRPVTGDHAVYERDLGIPKQLALLEDVLFEMVKSGEDLTWPERFMSSIPVGADLSNVYSNFLHRLVEEATGWEKEQVCEKMSKGMLYVWEYIYNSRTAVQETVQAFRALGQNNTIVDATRMMDILIEELESYDTNIV